MSKNYESHKMNQELKNSSVAVIGLGYVGMPLAVELSKHVKTTGFDINEKRVEELQTGWDRNREIRQSTLRTTNCRFTTNTKDIENCNIYIITVPTPVDKNNNPDLGPLEAASKTVAKMLQQDDIVVYESTVYPGVTENICGKFLEDASGLKCGEDFYLGYSPERINPGDTKHTLQTITKVVAGQTAKVSELLCELYGFVNDGNIFQAKNIMTAEASKAIENAQRDINVAFVNEITMILNKMGLSSHDVLEAAATKWNFLPFTPGLVGGHCISVDPYYLAQCATRVGHEPEVILSGRKINDNMGDYVGKIIDKSLKEKINPPECNILILGFTFKENINDIRNTKVIDVIKTLKNKGHKVDIHDPFANEEEVKSEYNLDLVHSLNSDIKYDAVVLLVPHQTYKEMTVDSIEQKLNKSSVVFDMHGVWRSFKFNKSVTYKTL